MRVLANENFPREAVEALRSHGHDVAWVRTDSPGSSDEEVIRRAAAEARVLIKLVTDMLFNVGRVLWQLSFRLLRLCKWRWL